MNGLAGLIWHYTSGLKGEIKEVRDGMNGLAREVSEMKGEMRGSHVSTVPSLPVARD